MSLFHFAAMRTRRLAPERTEPMYATVGTAVPVDEGWTFEPKYDGIRVLAYVGGAPALRGVARPRSPRAPREVQLVTRNHRDKALQFPEITDALRELGRVRRRPLVLDGEIVAIDRPGTTGRFQSLQSRMHATDAARIERIAREQPAILVVFDLLQDGARILLDAPWSARRQRLERLLPRSKGTVRISESSANPNTMLRRARTSGWEGVIAKRIDAPYRPAVRSRDWLKLKLQHRAEFVVGGWTEPRRSRQHLGALLIGYFDERGELHYAGHMGGGFSDEALSDMHRRLARLSRRTSPFVDPPETNGRAHWVRPEVVVEAKFAEWTAGRRLRQPIFLGVRDDKPARAVRRERTSLQAWGLAMSKKESLLRQLDRIEREGGTGELTFESGAQQRVTNLAKLYFPKDGITKGDVMRYYLRVAPALLPLIADRPLALKRYPDGIEGSSFFQQRATGSLPEGVRVAEVEVDGEKAPRFIGGDLETLIHSVQMGAITVHAWLSRLRTPDRPDFSLIDLDPGEGVPFKRVVELGRAIARVLEALGLNAAVKTSGSRGLHVGIPLWSRASYDDSVRLAERIAVDVIDRHPDIATVERRTAKRPRGSVYLDTQQNARGKSVVSPYAVRARSLATVSAPLRWSELGAALRLQAFTVRSEPRRLTRIGDLWGEAIATGNSSRDIRAALR